MGLKFLLDTNILSEPLKPEPDESVLASLEEHSNSLATASVVWHELSCGAKLLPQSKRKEKIERYLKEVLLPTFIILPYEHDAARWHADERARLTSKGLTPSFADSQIAAIATTNNLTLVTRNISDFKNFQDLAIANWFSCTE